MARGQRAIDGQNAVEMIELVLDHAGGKAFEVEGHELETKRLENSGQFCCHLGTESAWQFVAGNLDSDHFSMVTHAELPEAECAQCILALLDRAESLACNRAPILNARGQASRRGLIPHPQASAVRQFSNLPLG